MVVTWGQWLIAGCITCLESTTFVNGLYLSFNKVIKRTENMTLWQFDFIAGNFSYSFKYICLICRSNIRPNFVAYMLLLTYSTNKSYWKFLHLPLISLFAIHFLENYGIYSRHYKIVSKNQLFFRLRLSHLLLLIYRCSFVHRQNMNKNVLSKLPPINILTDMTRKLILFYMYLQVSKIKAYCSFDVFRTKSNNRNTFFNKLVNKW